MVPSLTASLFLLSVVFWEFVTAPDPVPIKAKAGADVTLPCKTAGDKAVVQAEWSRPDQTSAPVLLYKDKKVDASQLEAYKGRTSLLDAEKGDLSLVLKKVVDKDVGKYECRAELGAGATGTGATGTGTTGEAAAGTGARSSLKSDPVSIVVLTVEAKTSHGGDGLRPNVVLPVGLLVLLPLIAGLQ